jgi:G:T/U-mismatch repair DNA glycosylase
MNLSLIRMNPNRKIFLLLAFIFLGSVQTTFAQGNDLQTAASKIDKMITRMKRTKVIVTDFIGPKNAMTEYGQATADELSAELAKADANLNVLPRNGQSYTFGPSAFSQDFREGSAAWFLARSVGAEVVVTGDFQKRSDRVDLNFRVWDNPFGHNNMPGEKLGEFALRLSITPEQNILIGRTVPGDPQNGFRLTAGKKPSAYAASPACIDCAPPFGIGKAEVNLLLSVDTQGRVTKVELISASDQKIAGKVVKAAAKWRFHPAHGRNGQPIASQIPFELSLGNKWN